MASPKIPVLAVVVPVHGVEADLRECLDSILADPVAGVEIVAVDDCSPDSCGAILDEYSRRDSRVQVLHLGANVGLGRARNAGLERTTADYVWFVDGDDQLTAGAVRAVTERLAETRPDVLVVDHVELFDDGRTIAGTPPGALTRPTAEGPTVGPAVGPAGGSAASGPARLGPLTARPQLLRIAHSACTKVVRRTLLDEIGLRFHPGWYEDCSYTHPLLLAAQRIDTLDRVCYIYRQRTGAGGITRTRSARHFDVFDQYHRLFTAVDAAAPAHEAFRGELFRIMVDHHLVIVGNDLRLPAHLRRSFFRRMAADYRRWLPPDGYPVPGGVPGLKHRLVRHDAYPAYTMLRLAYRVAGRLRGLARRAPAPVPAVPSQRNPATQRTSPGAGAASRTPAGPTGPGEGRRR